MEDYSTAFDVSLSTAQQGGRDGRLSEENSTYVLRVLGVFDGHEVWTRVDP